MSVARGARFGPYVVSDPLGSGGMGEVYRATDTNLGRDVALKVLPGLVAHDPERLARFEREARTLAALSHPNIATVHGLERSDGTPALVMELVEGPTLADRIAHGPMPLDEALHVARQIAEGLEAAHAQGIVHRDLKPANVKVRPDGTVKVLDFGLAKALEPAAAAAGPMSATLSPTITSPAQTMHGMILGTAAYMSPEQARGRTVDARADIWAFGCVLYEMLTGRRAFGPSAIRRRDASPSGSAAAGGGASIPVRPHPADEDDDVTLTLARVLERDVELSALPPGVPPRVRQAIAVCLRKDVRQRAQAIGDVRLALEGAFDTNAPPAVHAATPRGVWARTLVALAAGAVLAAAALLPLVLRSAPLPAITRFQIFAPAGSRLPLGTPAISDDGRMLAYTVSDADGVSRIHVRALDRTDTRVLPGTEGAVHPFWAPDGRAIAFASPSDGQLKRIELDAGLPRALAGTTAPWHGTWSGRTILFVTGGPMRIPDEGGTVEAVSEVRRDAGERAINYPEFLSDGRRFLVRVSTSQKSAIHLASLGSRERTLVLDDVTTAALLARTPGAATYLLYMRTPDLLVHEFDEESGMVRGDPRVLVAGIGQVANPPIRPTVGVSRAGVLAYQTGGAGTTGQLGWVDRSGAEIGVLTLDASLARPRLSPDGTMAAGHRFDDGDTSVWVTDLQRGTATRLTFTGGGRDPVWSPDGTQLAYRKSTGDFGIYVIGADGSDERRVTDANDVPQSWSRDGFLLYQSGAKLLMTPVDRQEKPADVGPVNGRSSRGAFSPDGQFIAYTSDESGRNEVYVRATPPARQRIKLSIDGGLDPHWSGDGREIYFISLSGEMMAVDVAPGDRITAGVPRVLFRTVGRNTPQGWTVAADGKRFLLPRLDLQDAPITVVLNWWADMR